MRTDGFAWSPRKRGDRLAPTPTFDVAQRACDGAGDLLGEPFAGKSHNRPRFASEARHAPPLGSGDSASTWGRDAVCPTCRRLAAAGCAGQGSGDTSAMLGAVGAGPAP